MNFGDEFPSWLGMVSADEPAFRDPATEKKNSYIAIHALNAIDALGKKAAPLKEQIAALPTFDPKSPARVNTEYTSNLVNWLKTSL
jgi:hypothetical protein